MTLNDKIKGLNVALEKIKYDVLLERKLADRKVIKMDSGYDMELDTMKNENDKLKEKINKMSVIIQGLQTKTEKGKNYYGTKKNIINAKNTLQMQNDKNEMLRVVNLLREQLKVSDAEVKRLHAELYGPNKNIKAMGDYSNDVTYIF